MNVSLNFNVPIAGFQRDIAAHLAKLRSSLRALEDGSFHQASRLPRPGTVMQFDLGPALPKLERAVNDACRDCFLCLVRSLTEFLDRLIAMRRLVGSQLTLPNGLKSPQELSTFLRERVEEAYLKVARDHGLSSTAKVEEFEQLGSFEREASLSYFQLRRSLEHHAGVPNHDVTISFYRPILLSGQEEIAKMPAPTPISLKFERSTLNFPANKPVVLKEPDLEHICFTLHLLIGPGFIRAAYGLPPLNLANTPNPTRSQNG